MGKTKKQRSNIKMVVQIFRYCISLFIILLAILYYAEAWTGLGLFLVLLSAAIGFTLQKPITGMAAW